MARVKRAVGAHKKRKRVFKLAKGYFGAKSKQYRSAKQAVMKSMRYAYVGRKLKKRDMRRLWIVRINAEARQNGISYSQFMNGLKQCGIDLNRKILADMAVNDKAGFKELADTAKKKARA
ncbi:MAG TPA: 50S ribosomal protein L20 [Clostridiales bacterium]|nr:50S ribosomal protein L20 [Clostridiales bacterium]